MKRIWVLCMALFFPLVAAAQEPTFMEAATQPGSKQLYQRVIMTSPTLRHGLRADRPVEIRSMYGVRSDLALMPNVVFDEDGLTEGSIRLKSRFMQRDTGPIDTWRASLHVGAEWRDGRDPGPRLGVVSTTIRRRHGWNAQLEWMGGAPSDRRFEADVSYLYRLHPVTYRPATPGAWYAVSESLNTFGNDGERGSDLAFGLLYEARRWAGEIAVRLDEPEDGLFARTTRLGAGFRILW